jgi:hypothetical protein
MDKKSDFSSRMFKGINSHFDFWLELPVVGLFGGILFGRDTVKFHIDKTIVRQFSLTIFITNRVDNFSWC